MLNIIIMSSILCIILPIYIIYTQLKLKKLSNQCLEVDNIPVCFIDKNGIIINKNECFTQNFLNSDQTGNIPLVSCINIIDSSKQVLGEDKSGCIWMLRYIHVYTRTVIIFIPVDTDISWIHKLPIPCCIITNSHQIQNINRHMYEYISEWKNVQFEKFLHKSRIRDFQLAVEKAFAQTGYVSYMDTLWGTKNIPIKLSVVALNQNQYCICLHNIQELENIKQKAYVAQNLQLLGHLTASVVHDFNNVINAISLLLYSLQDKLSDEHHDDVKAIHGTTARAQELIKQLLEFSKDKTDKQETDPALVIKNFMQSLIVLAGEKVKLHTHIDESKQLVNLSASQILQITLNLVVNARDAHAKEITLNVSHVTLLTPKNISTGILAPKNYMMISVTDNGSGIPTYNIPHIFNAFFSTKKTGSGLGLATIYRLANMHSGGIDLQSEPGKTTFSVYIPCLHGSDLIQQLQTQNNQYHILLVDDDETGRDLMVRALKKQGYHITACEDGMKGLNAIDQLSDLSLIITDAIMPNLNGIQLIQKIKERNKTLPIILMTGFNANEVKESVPSDVAILSKPVQVKHLIYTITELLKSKPHNGDITDHKTQS